MNSLDEETLRDSGGRRPGALLRTDWYLFVALEADRPLASAARYALAGIDEVVIARGPERAATRSDEAGVRRLVLRLPGRSLSSIHARLHRTPAGWVLEDARSTNGSFVNGQRTDRAPLQPEDVVEVGHSFLLLRPFALPVERPPADCDGRDLAGQPTGFATVLPGLQGQLDELARIARSEVTTVLCGESGTGKEMLARGIHALSGRKGPFLAINCGALTESLAESQLFGHVRGAFSGAVTDAPGFVRAADGGTLLLDEIGDLGRSAQAALLRVLQEREVVPVGSTRAQTVDVRFIATAPRPLDQLVEAGSFRADLHARLAGFSHQTVPLRDRLPDLGLLVSALLARIAVSGAPPALAPEVALRLFQHRWPLNVRELEQALRRCWVLAGGGAIQAAHLQLDDPSAPAGQDGPGVQRLSAEDQELRQQLLEALAAAGGNVTQVARRLGKARMQVHRWMKRLAIDPSSFRH